MTSLLKSVWARLAGGSAREHVGGSEEPSAEAEHKGFRIRATPYAVAGGWQTTGVIEKAFGSGVKEHRFVRAEKHPSKDNAASFAIAKARQIIHERGEKVFGPG